MSNNKIYTNKAKAVLAGAIALLLYIIPLAVLAIIYRDRLFKDAGSSLTLFSMLIIIFGIVFAKKLVKQICGVITVAGFASLVMLILSLVIRTFVDDLFTIALGSIIGSILAWYPTKVAHTFSEYSKTEDGKLRADLTLKDVNNIIFGLTIED